MSSLQEELARLGLAKEQSAKSKKRRRPKRPRRAESPEDSLAAAYRARANAEKQEKRDADKAAKERKARKLALKNLIRKVSIDHKDGQIARHFQHGNRIKRVYVSEDQLKAINAGDIVIVQALGRYHLVELEHLATVHGIGEELFVFQASDDDQEPDDGVPDDLIW